MAVQIPQSIREVHASRGPQAGVVTGCNDAAPSGSACVFALYNGKINAD